MGEGLWMLGRAGGGLEKEIGAGGFSGREVLQVFVVGDSSYGGLLG